MLELFSFAAHAFGHLRSDIDIASDCIILVLPANMNVLKFPYCGNYGAVLASNKEPRHDKHMPSDKGLFAV
ncbi:hypothetical protein INT44_005383 [Umbelopsis vinacea]|uniref:Uncharacterized protein n=1 Tax=Umbelopsis vinacea TaxID=44442 RepID=A0A8H7Q9I8_9FUNG|nr:hypothetical protein INT44_005383 [Umbelopsis vinacea]